MLWKVTWHKHVARLLEIAIGNVRNVINAVWRQIFTAFMMITGKATSKFSTLGRCIHKIGFSNWKTSFLSPMNVISICTISLLRGPRSPGLVLMEYFLLPGYVKDEISHGYPATLVRLRITWGLSWSHPRRMPGPWALVRIPPNRKRMKDIRSFIWRHLLISPYIKPNSQMNSDARKTALMMFRTFSIAIPLGNCQATAKPHDYAMRIFSGIIFTCCKKQGIKKWNALYYRPFLFPSQQLYVSPFFSFQFIPALELEQDPVSMHPALLDWAI